MPTRSDSVQSLESEVQGREWAARSDTPKRSVFGNYRENSTRPLTPALFPSEGERENCPPSLRAPKTADSTALTGTTNDAPLLFPLPRRGGEGQGEGENHTQVISPLQTSIDHAIARSFVYRFVGKSFEDPTLESWAALTDATTHASFRAALEVLSDGNRALLQAGEGLLDTLKPENFEPFRSDCVGSFGHAARGGCPQNEIEYGDIKADPLFQPHRLADLAAFYRAFGLELTPDASERHDHICIELEFMSVLTAKEAYALEHQLDGEQLVVGRAAQRQFLREHLGRWVPAFARRLLDGVGAGTLGAVANFTRAFIEAECARLGVPPGGEDLLLRPVDEAAERMCESCGLPTGLPGALAAT